MADWLSTGASLLGAYLGSKGNDTKTTSTNAIDSRMGDYIYGNGSTTQGVLPAATDWYQKNQSGLNDQSLQGLNRQWNTASDPATAQGYTNMQGLGSSLMGGGVAGNPFTTGRASLGGGANLGLSGPPAQPMAQPQFHNPATMGNPSMGGTSGPFTQPTNTWHPQTPQAALTNWAQGPTNWNGGNGGNGGNGANTPGTPGEMGSFGGFDGLMSSIGGFMSAHPEGIASIAGLLGVPLAGLGVQGLMGLLGGNSAPSTNASISSMANSYGMGGWGGGGNSSSNNGGGDASRGSQSDNGGRNGGDSGGF